MKTFDDFVQFEFKHYFNRAIYFQLTDQQIDALGERDSENFKKFLKHVEEKFTRERLPILRLEWKLIRATREFREEKTKTNEFRREIHGISREIDTAIRGGKG